MTAEDRRTGLILLGCFVLGLMFADSTAALLPLGAICVAAIFWGAWLAWRAQKRGL